ncbi:MAG: M20/M25/M40 family metallo-hydrolase [Candidatus Aminicenantes bacterium]|jgi:glutamate carboxypeptidase
MLENPSTRIMDLIEGWEEEQIEFVIALCEQNSYTFNTRGNTRVASMILEKLEGIFALHRVDEQNRVGNHHLLRSREEGKAVYLLGHTDTVFPEEHPFQSCKKEGDWLLGPGTADMKGGLAVLVYALKALKEAGGMEDLSLSMILGGDEENGSPTSRKIYEEERNKAILCLVAECAGENGEIVVSRNGKAGGKLECRGLDSHVSSVAAKKASAILELAHKVIAFESLNDSHSGIRVNVGRIEGGLGPSTVPGNGHFLFDLRWQDEKHYPDLLERVNKIAAHNEQSGCATHLEILNYRPAMPFHTKTELLLSRLNEVAGMLGQTIPTEHRRGTSDGNFFGLAGIPTLDGFGPIGIDDHTPNERIWIPSLKTRTILLALFLLHLKDLMPS